MTTNSDYDPAVFEYIFHPRGVAIIGSSPHDLATLAHLQTKIKDRLFLVNPKYREIRGLPSYPSVCHIMEPIDYAIIGVGAERVADVIKDCIKKGVKVAQIFTAGFSETGIPERIALEEEIKTIAQGRIRLIGPNCFGVYCPASGLTIIPEAPEEVGNIGVIAQSGSVTESFSYFARTKGLKFSKIVSYGNAIDLDSADFLYYMADDSETEIIALYVEGTKNGLKFKDALHRAARKKPVIAIKGGMTEQGIRAASSHTASLSSTPILWQALFAQCGAVQVENFEDMVNTVLAFSRAPIPVGRAVALISNSGGFSVIQTDLCARLGVNVPKFPPATISTLRELVPAAGTAIGNPLDAWPMFYKVEGRGTVADVIVTCGEAENIHTVIFHFDQFRYLRRVLGTEVGVHMERLSQLIVEGCTYVRDRLHKPVMAVVSLDPFLEDEEDRRQNLLLKQALAGAGFPVYATLDGVVRATFHLCRYRRRT